MGFYKSLTGNIPKCIKCPMNSWSFGSGQNHCKCQHNYYRESESDPSTSCKRTHEITTENLELKFIDQDRLNISVNRMNIGKKIQVEMKCNNNLCLHRSLNISGRVY